jgi:hypothetical protein
VACLILTDDRNANLSGKLIIAFSANEWVANSHLAHRSSNTPPNLADGTENGSIRLHNLGNLS